MKKLHTRQTGLRAQMLDWMIWAMALAGPAVITAGLVGYTHQVQRDYVFIYLGLVAVVGVLRGVWPALACAAISFLLVDYFFVPPFGTLTIADEQDIVSLLAFLVIAGVVGFLASRRRRALLESQALARQLREVNSELVHVTKEEAEAVCHDMLDSAQKEGGAPDPDPEPLPLGDASAPAAERLHHASPERAVDW